MQGVNVTSSPDARRQIWAAVLALAVITLLITRISGAAFSATTSSPGSSFGAGSISLSNDAVGALFTVTDMAPGDSSSECILVTYTGAFDPGVVKVYSGGLTDSANGLGDHLNVSIVQGSAADALLGCGLATFLVGASTIVSGETLNSFATDHADYASGFGTWDPTTTGDVGIYEITVELDAAAPGDVQGETVTDVIFTWETQS